jgi:hypothetical protein
VIEDAADDYLQAIDARAQGLSALVQGALKVFVYLGNPRVDHIRVTRSGASFEVQVVSHVCVSLPPAGFDDDPTQAFTEAWRDGETGGHLVLDAEAVAILTYVVEVEANGATN